MIFLFTVLVILMVVLACFYLVLFASDESLTYNDLDTVYRMDRAYISLAPRESWNDLD